MKSEVFNMDCMEYMRQCRDKQFSLAIVDPPYGVEDMTGKEFSHGSGKLKNRIFQIDCERIDTWDVAPPQEYFDELFRSQNYTTSNSMRNWVTGFNFRYCRCIGLGRKIICSYFH